MSDYYFKRMTQATEEFENYKSYIQRIRAENLSAQVPRLTERQERLRYLKAKLQLKLLEADKSFSYEKELFRSLQTKIVSSYVHKYPEKFKWSNETIKSIENHLKTKLLRL